MTCSRSQKETRYHPVQPGTSVVAVLLTLFIRQLKEGAVISESPDLLAAMKDGLMGAENATRKGDLEAVYMA